MFLKDRQFPLANPKATFDATTSGDGDVVAA
jgi:hypothetical protein